MTKKQIKRRSTYEVNHISTLLLNEINNKIQVDLISTLMRSNNSDFLGEMNIAPVNKDKDKSSESPRYSTGIVL